MRSSCDSVGRGAGAGGAGAAASGTDGVVPGSTVARDSTGVPDVGTGTSTRSDAGRGGSATVDGAAAATAGSDSSPTVGGGPVIDAGRGTLKGAVPVARS